MLASVLIHWLGANFPHHSPEMTTATWQTVETWPSRCPNSLGAPVFHGTWFFSFNILSPREDLIPLETAEKCGVYNYPARRSLVTGGGKKAEKNRKKNVKWKFQTQIAPNILGEQVGAPPSTFSTFSIEGSRFYVHRPSKRQGKNFVATFQICDQSNRWLVCNDGSGWSIERCLAGKKTKGILFINNFLLHSSTL